MVSGFILALLVVTLTSLLIRHEAWPIVNYPMFDVLNPRVDTDVVTFFVVTGKDEKRLGYEHGPMLDLAHILPVMLDAKGAQSAEAKGFLTTVLENMQRDWKKEGYPAPPTGLKGYLIRYHYPDSGNYAPQIVGKTLIIEVGNSAP
jgi:hypothetical protein